MIITYYYHKYQVFISSETFIYKINTIAIRLQCMAKYDHTRDHCIVDIGRQ